MGHYSSSYEFDHKKRIEKDKDEAKSTIVDFAENAKSLSDLKFIADIINNIDDYKAFKRVIGNFSEG